MCVWACVLIGVVAVPIVHGYQVAPEGWSFSGFIGAFHNDYNGYLAWTRQAEEGQLLFRNLFSAEPHGRVFAHPLFWLMGTAAATSGASIMTVWHLTQAVGCLLMVYSIYRLASMFTDSVATRMLSLVLATTASGFGWWVDVPRNSAWLEKPIDLWMAQANQAQALLTSFFTLPIALAFLLLALVRGLEYLRHGRRRDAVLSGLFALALAATHQYNMATLYVVLAVWMAMTGWHRFRGLLVIAALSLPYCLYSVGVISFDPVFSKVTWAMPSATPWAIAVGWGLPLLLAMGALALPAVWRENRDVRLLLAWLLSGLVLMYVPIGFERKLIWGLHVVLCLLASMGWIGTLRTALRALAPAKRAAVMGLLSVALVGFSSIGTIELYRLQFERNRSHVFGDYLPDAYLEAMRWLDDNSEHAEVVIASPAIAPYLPGESGVTVFWGHWAQTLDRGAKERFLRRLFQPAGSKSDDIARVLQRDRGRFIVLDARSLRDWKIRRPPAKFAFDSLAAPVFRNPAVTIWRVHSPDPAKGGSGQGGLSGGT